eukprot:s1891_g4.t1
MMANRCGKCDTLWHRCIDSTFVHGGKANKDSYTSWTETTEDWEQEWPQRRSTSKSPRASRARRKSTPKGHRNQFQEDVAAPDLDPPWNSKNAYNLPAVPSTSATSSGEAQSAGQLNALVTKLQVADQPLSPQEIQKIIAETTTPKVSSKSMHQAVSKVDQARAKLKSAKSAREKLHASWTRYVEQSVKRWKGFAEDFANKDSNLAKEVTNAREALQEARTILDQTKELHSQQDARILEPEMISDGEAEDDPAVKVDTAEAIQQGITSMVEGLEKIKVRPADDEGEEATLAKKPRREPDNDSVLGSGALVPFAKPGK